MGLYLAASMVLFSVSVTKLCLGSIPVFQILLSSECNQGPFCFSVPSASRLGLRKMFGVDRGGTVDQKSPKGYFLPYSIVPSNKTCAFGLSSTAAAGGWLVLLVGEGVLLNLHHLFI